MRYLPQWLDTYNQRDLVLYGQLRNYPFLDTWHSQTQNLNGLCVPFKKNTISQNSDDVNECGLRNRKKLKIRGKMARKEQ